jgi:sporulation protein YlmC with PRC-barrel domain
LFQKFSIIKRYTIQGKVIGRLGNSTFNFTRKTDIALIAESEKLIGFSREIQCGIPSSTNEFTYTISLSKEDIHIDVVIACIFRALSSMSQDCQE